MNTLVTLNKLADEAKLHRLSIKKSVIRAGIVPRLVRINGRRCYAVTREEADRYIAQRNTDGIVEPQLAVCESIGGIYLVRPDPVFRENRLKIGKAVSFDNRIKAHKCISPELEVLALWPTPALWMESMALGILGNMPGVTFASPEVFDAEDYQGVHRTLEDAFSKQGVKPLTFESESQPSHAES